MINKSISNPLNPQYDIVISFLYMFVILCLSKSGVDTPSLREYCWGESMTTPLALGVLKDPPTPLSSYSRRMATWQYPHVWTNPYHSDGHIIVITCHYIYPIYYPIVSLLNPYIPFFLFIFVGKIPHFVKAPHLVIVLGLVVVLSFFFQFLSHFLTTSVKNKAQHAPNPWCYLEGKSKMAMGNPYKWRFEW